MTDIAVRPDLRQETIRKNLRVITQRNTQKRHISSASEIAALAIVVRQEVLLALTIIGIPPVFDASDSTAIRQAFARGMAHLIAANRTKDLNRKLGELQVAQALFEESYSRDPNLIAALEKCLEITQIELPKLEQQKDMRQSIIELNSSRKSAKKIMLDKNHHFLSGKVYFHSRELPQEEAKAFLESNKKFAKCGLSLK